MARLRHATTHYYEGIQSTVAGIRAVEQSLITETTQL